MTTRSVEIHEAVEAGGRSLCSTIEIMEAGVRPQLPSGRQTPAIAALLTPTKQIPSGLTSREDRGSRWPTSSADSHKVMDVGPELPDQGTKPRRMSSTSLSTRQTGADEFSPAASPMTTIQRHSLWSTPLGRSSTAQTSLAFISAQSTPQNLEPRISRGFGNSFKFPVNFSSPTQSVGPRAPGSAEFSEYDDEAHGTDSVYESDRSLSDGASSGAAVTAILGFESGVEQTQASSSQTGGKSIHASIGSEPGPTEVGSESSTGDTSYHMSSENNHSSGSYPARQRNHLLPSFSPTGQLSGRSTPIFSLFPSRTNAPRESTARRASDQAQYPIGPFLSVKRLSDPTLGIGSRISTLPPIPSKSPRRRHSSEQLRVRHLQIRAPVVEPLFADSYDFSARRNRAAKVTRLSTVPSLVEELSEVSGDPNHGLSHRRSSSRRRDTILSPVLGSEQHDTQSQGLSKMSRKKWVLRAHSRSLKVQALGLGGINREHRSKVVRNPGAGHLVRDSIVSAQANKSLQGSIMLRSESGDILQQAGDEEVGYQSEPIHPASQMQPLAQRRISLAYHPAYPIPRLLPSKRSTTRMMWSAPSPELQNSGALKLASKLNFEITAFAIGFIFPPGTWSRKMVIPAYYDQADCFSAWIIAAALLYPPFRSGRTKEKRSMWITQVIS